MIISKIHTNYLTIFTGILFCLLTAGCDNSSNSDISGKTQHSRTQTSHRVEVYTVKIKPVSLLQTVSGTLEAVTKIRLYNEESGRITRLPYHEGARVKKGTLLVQMDNALLKTDVAKASASREQARVDLSRVKKLLPKKISTEEEVAKAQTELDLAVAEENRQLTRLRRTSIKAPIDGIIISRLFEPGDMLAAQSHILSIINPDALLLKASISERWIPLVKPDQKVSLHIDALGDVSFDASVNRIHPTINAATHKGIIEILLEPVPEGATVGQFARAKIRLLATDRLVIPAHTIQYEPQGSYVYRVLDKEDDGNKTTIAQKVYIDQGQQYGSMVEILSGLHTGDQVISRGYLGLRDGKKISVTGQAAEDNR